MAMKNHSESVEDIQEAEITSNKCRQKTKRSRWKKGDYIFLFVWIFSIFAIVMSARVIVLPGDEFPVPLSILICLGTLYVVTISYGATLSPGSTRAILPNLVMVILMYVAPAFLATVFLNEMVPKAEITKRENDAIELQYVGYDISFWFDADITYYRPFVSIFPFNTMEASVGDIYYDGETYNIGECVDNDSADFYAGESVSCLAEDGLDTKVRLDLDKLSYKVSEGL